MYLQLSKFQPLIGVVGLPRSGTTILANLLDSCDNGFCVVEPIWAAECGVQAKEYSTTKTGTFSTAVSSEVPNKLRDVVKEKNLGFGAIKETYRDHQLFCTQPVIENCDILLASVRDPLDTFASWKRTGWGSPYNSVSFFVNNYINFHSKMQQLSQSKPVINIVHEDLCKEKLIYFNSKFASEGQIVGDFKLSGVESPYSMGDGRACSSKDFEQNPKKSTVSVLEMNIIQKRLRAFYMSLKR